MKTLQKQAKTVPQALSAIKTSINRFITDISDLASVPGLRNSNAQVLNNKFKDFNKTAELLKNFKSIASSLNKVGGKIDLTKLISEVKSMINGLGGLATSSPANFNKFIQLANAIEQVARSCRNLNSATQKATSAVNRMGHSVHKINPIVRQFFTAFAGYNVVYSIVRTIQKATKQMVQLQYAMARVNTITRVGSTTIRRWTYQVMSMSSTFGIAKQDITKALYEINSATILGSQAMEVLNASVRAARAGYTDTTKVAELLSKVINAYGYSARDAAYLSDVLFKTVEVGINTMEQLSQYLGRVVTVAANAGVSFEEVSAAIATMTARGLQTNIAVTALNSAIMKLSQGSGKLNPTFRQMGYASSAAALATGGLSSAIQILHRATNGNTQALSKLGFNYRDIRAVTILASEAQSVFKQHLDDMKNSAGATDKALSQVADTLQYKWDQFKQTISNTVIEFQNFVNSSEILKGLLSVLSGVAQTFGQVAFALQQNLTLLQHFIKFIVVAYALNKAGKLIGTTLISAFRKSSVQVKALTAEVRAFGFVFSSTGVRASFTLKKLIVSFKALRASVIAAKLSVVALKAVMSFGAALVQFALIQAALWAISKLTDDATDATKKYREEVSRMKKDLNNVLPGIYEAVGALQGAQLGSSNEKQLFQNAKDALSSLNQQIEQYESKKEQLRNKKGTNLAQYNQVKYTLRSLLKQRKELQSIIDAQAKIRHEYATSNAQLRRTELNLKSIREGLQKSRSDRKDSIAKEFKDLAAQIQYKNLKEYFNQLGVDLDNARYNVSLFQTQVKDALKRLGDDKSSIDTFNKNLLKSGDLLFRIQKGLQNVAEKLKPFKELQIIAKDPFGFGRQYLKLDQLIKQHQKFASKISKAQQVTITSNSTQMVDSVNKRVSTQVDSQYDRFTTELYTNMKPFYKSAKDAYRNFDKMSKVANVRYVKGSDGLTPILEYNTLMTHDTRFREILQNTKIKNSSGKQFSYQDVKKKAPATDPGNSKLEQRILRAAFQEYKRQSSYVDLNKLIPQKYKTDPNVTSLFKGTVHVRDLDAAIVKIDQDLDKIVKQGLITSKTDTIRKETMQSVRALLLEGKTTQAQNLWGSVFKSNLSYNKLLTNQDTFDQWRKKFKSGKSVQTIFEEQMQALRKYAKAQNLGTQQQQQLTKQLSDLRKKFLDFEKSIDKINTKFMDIKGYGKQLTQSQLQKRISNRASLVGGSFIAGRTGYDWAHQFNQWSLIRPADAPQSFSEYLTKNLKLDDKDKAQVLQALFDLSNLTQMNNRRKFGTDYTKRAFGNALGSSITQGDVSLRNRAYSVELHNLIEAQKQYNKQAAQQSRLLAAEKNITLQQHKAFSEARKAYIKAMKDYNNSIDNSYASMSFSRDFVHSQYYANASQAIDAQKAVYGGYFDDLSKVKQAQSLDPNGRLDVIARNVLGQKGAARFMEANNAMRQNAQGTQAVRDTIDALTFELRRIPAQLAKETALLKQSVRQEQESLAKQRSVIRKLQSTYGDKWVDKYGASNLAELQQRVDNLKYNKERLSKYEGALKEDVKVPEPIQAQMAMSIGSSEFVETFLKQTSKTPEQKSLESIDKNVKKLTKKTVFLGTGYSTVYI